MCGERIKAAATRCRYCGEELQNKGPHRLGLAPPTRIGQPTSRAAACAQQPPGKVTVIRLMIFVGAGIMFLWGGMTILVFCLWPFSYLSLVGAILAFIEALGMDKKPPRQRIPIIQILCLLNLDITNPIFGVIELILMNDPAVSAYYASIESTGDATYPEKISPAEKMAVNREFQGNAARG
jgi:hypothetical protein